MFDTQEFLEKYHPFYYQCDEIALIDDIDKLLDGDTDEGDCASTGIYANWTKEELENERNKLMTNVLKQAFDNYLTIEYPFS